jgi:curved DNA-binding protein CbpA
MNPYEVLGIRNGSDPAEIRRAYLALARRHHPDAHTGDGPAARARAETRMREINDAWALLSDPERKRRYDATVEPGSGGPAPGGVRDVPSSGWHPRSEDTGWMADFEAWRQETDDAVPPEQAPSAARSSLTIFPVALFAVSIAAGCVAMVLQSRPLLAVSFVGVAVAALLFLLLPMLVMAQRPGRRR